MVSGFFEKILNDRRKGRKNKEVQIFLVGYNLKTVLKKNECKKIKQLDGVKSLNYFYGILL